MALTKDPPINIARHDNDDDEEEEDEDYDPTQDQEAMEAEKEDEAEENALTLPQQPLRPLQTSYPVVDKAFQELFGYPWGTVFVEPQETKPQASKRRRTTRHSNSTTKRSKNEELLTQLFGHEAALKIIHAPVVLPQSRLQPPPLPPLEVSLQQGKRSLTLERKRFAGVEMWVQSEQTQDQKQQSQPQASLSSNTTTATAATAQTTHATNNASLNAAATIVPVAPPLPAATTATATIGLDAVLQELAGPSKLSTVAKTSADWDVFKTQQGSAAEVLEERAQGKDAFLVKQDFLSRVDVRRFEQEKAQRDLQRSSKK